MAKQIIVTLGGNTSTFDFKKISRSDLYGKTSRRALDPEGEPCRRAQVTKDGSLLLRSGMTAQGYFKQTNGEWVPTGERIGMDLAGRPVEKVASSLGEAQELEGPVNVEDLFDVDKPILYALNDVEVDAGLKKSLEAGELYRFPFNYRADYEGQVAYLFIGKEDDRAYCLVGSTAHAEWHRKKEVAVDTFSEEDPFGDGDDDDMMDF